MPGPSNPTIDVNLNFHGNPHSKPTVDNSTTQNNTVPGTQASLEWRATPNQDGVEITGVTFFRNQTDKTNKTNAYNPPYLNLPGGHDGTDVTTWKIDFVSGNGPQTTAEIYYDVHFKDDDWSEFDWDPKLTIEPR